ncbi:MAG: hypothetical protein KF781_10295 [Chitinophagaceae bacterium]|nr:hypothetical protein [Chitinophagaceae bacterium]MCW5904909.1 hypothetical protein [Chitinophagaceae bacterium]
MKSSIVILPLEKIDYNKWNACVAANSNGLIYAYSYYLNAMSNKWFGVIINDYETIFPIPVKQKFSIQYAYTPAFTQQLGFIGNTKNITNEVIKAIQNFIKYGSFNINFFTTDIAEKLAAKPLNNFIIHLNNSFASIQKKYKKTMAYSLSKANKQHFSYLESNNIKEALLLYKAYNKNNLLHVTATDYTNFHKLLLQLQSQENIIIRKVVNKENELMSIALLMKDNKRYYNILNTTTEAGRKTEANYFLYNKILQELSNQKMIFDFEGSDLLGVKKFYEKFGAINQPYFLWHYNVLPKPIKWLKK